MTTADLPARQPTPIQMETGNALLALLPLASGECAMEGEDLLAELRAFGGDYYVATVSITPSGQVTGLDCCVENCDALGLTR